MPAKKKTESYNDIHKRLQDVIEQIDQENDFDKKCALYRESLDLIGELEQKLSAEQEILVTYIKK